MSDRSNSGDDRLSDSNVSRRGFLYKTATGAVVLTATAAGVASPGPEPASTHPQGAGSALAGRMTQYKSGDLTIPAYLSRSKVENSSAVLVIHEVFGLNDHIKSVADRIAAAGFNALAPNFFARTDVTPPKDDSDMDALRRAASSIPTEAAIRDMQAALNYLKTVKGIQPRFASIGFCMGGGFSYQLATHTKDLSGAVIFYGRMPIELVPMVSCPLLGNFGALDQGIPPDTVKEVAEALRKAGKIADFKIYPDAKHGFFNDTRPQVYNAAAAADAWQRTVSFFNKQIGRLAAAN
jgi:carboxymethylenebutenolidase